jgi:hypothetical protein
MPDPVMLAVATALAVRTAEAAVTGGSVGLASLIRLVRRRFSASPDALKTLEDAQGAPNDPESVRALAGSLARFAAQDRDFDADLRALWTQVNNTNHGAGSVVNLNSGTISGSLLQGRDFTLNGQLHFGGPAGER